ncbi:DUF3889 domain-containing protein [Pseudoneobacillus sp. C159]
MRRHTLALMTMFMFFISGYFQVQAEKIDYEKYGSIAISIVKADYPGEPVTEYQFLGRENLTDAIVQDSFKFIVKENGKNLNVLVKVKHSIQNNKLVSLTVEEQK